jgi:hypothetical protein
MQIGGDNSNKILVFSVIALLGLFVTLARCEPDHVDQKMIGHCLDKGWVLHYYSNGLNTSFTCEPKYKLRLSDD